MTQLIHTRLWSTCGLRDNQQPCENGVFYVCVIYMNVRGFPAILQTLKMKKVVAFGNPLLDTTISVYDTVLLDKYNLKLDGQKEIAENEMKRLSQDVSGYQQHISAGGCAQNSLRVLQWLMAKKCRAVIFGSVGKDKEAAILTQLLEDDGVQTRYFEQDDLPTGKTIALVSSEYRSLVAHIGAAEKLPLNQFLLEKDVPNLVLSSDFVYIEGFFLTNRVETAKYILDFCNKHNKVAIFNISGEYVCDLYPTVVKHFVENSDIVFGNKREFEALAKIMNMKNVNELTNHLIKGAKNKMDTYGNIIIITDGSNPGTCISKCGKIENFVVPKIDPKDIKDTTGAGDAFTGGFIAGLCRNKPLADCAKIGCYSAFHIIQQTGCTLPNFQPNILDCNN
ncbi:adenosine kinase 2 [Anoplophora glabripennis]|nr:adenosine kinase 2 [Anoplophora glabripennis]